MSDYGLTSQAQSLLAKVQALFGPSNVSVTSGYRSPGSNATISGASKSSQHMSGNAFDFHVAGMTPAQVQQTVAASGIQFGQSIQEYGAAAGAGTNHLGVGSKGQLLTANNGVYKTTGYAAQVGFGRAALTKYLGDTTGNKIADSLFGSGQELSAPGNAIDAGLSSATSLASDWFGRITIGLLALLLIGVALVMLSGKSVTEIAGKVPPIT